ncbi:MAG: hypothetical protein E7090_00010 [Bacteroidales bacterium]|nr:hypothetical protein [Bacteroidales bacterium]
MAGILVKTPTNNKANRRNHGILLQFLETIKILETTTSYEIFKSRYAFALKLAKDTIKIPQSNLQTAKTKYLEKYSLNELSFKQESLLANPESLSNIYYMAELETAFFVRLCNKTQDEMSQLKTNAAKQRRQQKVLEVAKLIMEQDLNNRAFQVYHKKIIEQLHLIGINSSINYTS